jgi:hypothetical protein
MLAVSRFAFGASRAKSRHSAAAQGRRNPWETATRMAVAMSPARMGVKARHLKATAAIREVAELIQMLPTCPPLPAIFRDLRTSPPFPIGVRHVRAKMGSSTATRVAQTNP